jgi:hypothetical protein
VSVSVGSQGASSGAGASTTGGVGGESGSSGSHTGSSGTSGTSGASGTSGSSGTSSAASTGSGGGSSGGLVRLLAIGDMGEGNVAQNAVADQMSAKCIKIGGCDAVLINGDNFYDNGVSSVDDPQWLEKFEAPYDRPGLNGLPFYAVLGNHDYGVTSSGDKQAQIDYSSLPVGTGPGTRASDKWRMPDAYYDVIIQHVHIFGIDTQDFSEATQENDMSMRVAASKATWKLVFGHHPRYTSGEHYWDNQLLGFAGMFDFQRAIYCDADIFMTGHDHDMEFIDKGRDSSCPETYFIISGAASKTREGNEFTPTDSSQVYYEDQIEGFAYFEFSDNKLLFEFIDKTGAVTFTKTMTK